MKRVSLINLQPALDDLLTSKLIAVDTETTGLEWTDRPFAITFATKSNEYYFDAGFDIEILSQILNQEIVYTFQNAKFDMRMLRHIGLEVGGIIKDITVLARAVDNTHLEYSLAAQAKRAGFQPKQDTLIKSMIKSGGFYSNRRDFFGVEYKNPQYDMLPRDVLMEYACHDARLTYDLCEMYTNELDNDPRTKDLLDMEFALTRVCFEMEWTGVKLDIQETMDQLKDAENGLKDLYERFQRSTGLTFDNKPSTLVKAFERAGEQFVYTDKGNPSFTDDVLAGFKSEAASIVRDIRFLQKRVSAFYKPLLNLQSRGTLRPTMWQGGTASGRFSYSDPNLQQIPKEDKEESTRSIRSCIVPREGKVLVSIDYKAQEFRMMLAYAGQMDLIEKVMAGFDPHQATAETVRITRKNAKTLNFMLIYGAAAPKVAEALGISINEAKALLTQYFMALPYVDRFIAKCKNTARQRGMIYTWAGRRLTFTDPSFTYKAPNALIQGGGADVCKYAMVRLHELGLTPLIQVHDQLVFEFDDDADLDRKIKTCKDIMEGVFPEKNGILLEVDVTLSRKSFAEKDQEPWKEK